MSTGWVKLTPNTGLEGVTSVDVEITEVNESIDRSKTIAVGQGENYKELVVNQLGKRERIFTNDGVELPIYVLKTKAPIFVPYIVSKGNSWADTGLYLDPTIHRVQGSIIVDDLSMVSSGNVYILEGGRSETITSTKTNIIIRKLSPTSYEIRRDWGVLDVSYGEYDGVVYEVGKEYTFDFTPEYTEIGGLRIERVAASDGPCPNSYWIGKMNDPRLNGTGYVSCGIRGTKRIFSVYATGEIIGESDSSFNKSTSEFNYYDTISEKYLENKGSEPWSAAYEPWVYEMGRPLSYLRSDGDQWIDTKFIIPEGFNYQVETYVKKIPNHGTQFWYGAATSSTSIDNLGVYTTSNNSSIYVVKRKDAITDKILPAEQLSNYVLLTQNKNGGLFGEIPYTLQELRDVYPPDSFYLFAINRGGVPTLPSDGLEVSFWRVKDLDNNNYAINLIPLITWEGVKGYLNLVNRELLLNQGTGEFQVPTIPVYAINWQDENFDPIEGKVAEVGTGITSGLKIEDWTEAQKQTFRGKKIKISWKLSATDVVGLGYQSAGFNIRLYYIDGTLTNLYGDVANTTIFSGLTEPYTLATDYSYSRIAIIEDKEISNLQANRSFLLPKVQSGELKAYDIKWEVDVPEWEISAIETLNSVGISAYADHGQNVNLLNQIGISS